MGANDTREWQAKSIKFESLKLSKHFYSFSWLY